MTNRTNIPGEGLLFYKDRFNEPLDRLFSHPCTQTDRCDTLDGIRGVLQAL